MIKQGSRQETETNIVNIEYLYVSKRHEQSNILYRKIQTTQTSSHLGERKKTNVSKQHKQTDISKKK